MLNVCDEQQSLIVDSTEISELGFALLRFFYISNMIVLKTIQLQRGFEIPTTLRSTSSICSKLKGDLDLILWILRQNKVMTSIIWPPALLQQQQQESVTAATKLGFQFIISSGERGKHLGRRSHTSPRCIHGDGKMFKSACCTAMATLRWSRITQILPLKCRSSILPVSIDCLLNWS